MTAVHALLSPGEAQPLTQRIKQTASNVREGMFRLRNLIEEAKASNAWSVLGFASWTAYLVDALGDEPLRVSRDERHELVAYLAGEGLSRPAIASATGVDERTVQRDFRVVEREQGRQVSLPVGSGSCDGSRRQGVHPPRGARGVHVRGPGGREVADHRGARRRPVDVGPDREACRHDRGWAAGRNGVPGCRG